MYSSEVAWLGNEDVTIATRHETSVSKAPGIITVITGEEIKNSGYRTFAEILRTVPGFEILKMADFGDVVPAVRGIESANKVRLMIDGHFVNNPLRGSAFNGLDDFPVENIKKIEIIRGPGSALYGENAFLAVINIITKDASDIGGVRVTSGYGSFNTYEENVIFGEKYGKVSVSGMLHYRQTDGFDGILGRDRQTTLDGIFGTSASNAPGNVQDGRQEFAMNLKVEYNDLWFHGWYNNKNRDTFIGPQYALSDESDIENNYVFGEIGYKKVFNERLTMRPRIYYDQFDIKIHVEAYEEGAKLPFDTNGDGIYDLFETYPDGFVGIGSEMEKAVGTEVPFDYELFDNNILTLGLEYRLINQGNVHYSSNLHPATFESLDSMQNFSDTYPYLEEATRRIWAVYLQDTWDVTETLNVTMGLRRDQYSDFGSAISPRTGLTWSFMKDATLKLLYGEAFRAPSFFEMYIANQPVLRGNEDLDPETIRTYEAGLSYRFNKYVTSSLNYFYNDVKDLIVLRPLAYNPTISRYENFADAHIQGVEMETKVDIAKGNYVFMNYTFQNPEDNHGNDLPFVAQHKGNIGVNAHYWKYMNTNISSFISGKRSREEGDERNDLPAYSLLNLSVTGRILLDSAINFSHKSMRQILNNPAYLPPAFQRKMLKHTLCLCILAIFSLITCAVSDVIGREGMAVIIKSQEISAYNDVAEGFQRDCQNNAIHVKAIYDLKGDIENGKHIVLDVREIKPKPDIILAIGTLASTLAKKHIKDTPIIFCAVINHELLDLQGTNIYAISSGVPYTEQFAVLKKLFNTRKNIGILYDPIKTERIVSELTSLGNNYDYNFITEKVSSKKDVGDALKAISKKIDVLWIVPDDTIISKESIDQFVETSRKNHLPIFCTSSALIKLGALISISPDYYSMGGQAARIACGLLRNPSQNPPPVEQPEKLKITINVKTAEILKVDVSPFLSLPDVVLYR